ncbi:MAG: hypothetical protein KO464_09240 [Candidatus Methanofastidiosum sp.]|nr:hypothetical protein [Methanofastidiosum sp.]
MNTKAAIPTITIAKGTIKIYGKLPEVVVVVSGTVTGGGLSSVVTGGLVSETGVCGTSIDVDSFGDYDVPGFIYTLRS